MRRFVLVPCSVVAALAAGLVFGTTIPSGQKLGENLWRDKVPPFSTLTYSVTLEARQRAVAVCIGDGRTYLGLYVYDKHGNCVAHDDVNVAKTRDDLAVVWYPTEESVHTVEVVNFGRNVNNLADGGLAVK